MPVKTRLPKRPRALSARREAAARILERLAALYPDAACSLNFANPFELLVATVLSAQTTDARVNAVTPELFSRFRGDGDGGSTRAGGDPPAPRVLPRQDEVLPGVGGVPVRELRRRRPGDPSRPRHSAGRRAEDGERRARRRLRDPGDNRRHPCWASGPSMGLDAARGPRRSGGGHRLPRARRGLDDRLPQDHLSRPPGLPFAQTGVPLVSDRRLVPLLPPLRRG